MNQSGRGTGRFARAGRDIDATWQIGADRVNNLAAWIGAVLVV